MSPLFFVVAGLGLSLLVIIHESGHYLAARAYGMRVLRFSLGFGPTIVKFQPKGSPTVFQICAIPFLAYVQIAGMNPAEEVDPKDPDLFQSKSLIARVVPVVAGPVANYLAASLLIFVLAQTFGLRDQVFPSVVKSIAPDSAAAAAGLVEGDEIIRANGEAIEDITDLQRVNRARVGQATVYVYRRAGVEHEVTMTPRPDHGNGIIGVAYEPVEVWVRLGVRDAAVQAVLQPIQATVISLYGVYDMISRRTTEQLSGPVGMTRHIVRAVELGPNQFLDILWKISVALGFMNLLPFPGLDGGRLAFLAYEAVTRRRPNERIETIVHTVGIVVLLCLIAYVTLFQDMRG